MTEEPTILKTLASADGQYRLQIYRRNDGLYGFFHHMRAEALDGPCWTPVWPSPAPICVSAETAEAEARSRINWLEQI